MEFAILEGWVFHSRVYLHPLKYYAPFLNILNLSCIRLNSANYSLGRLKSSEIIPLKSSNQWNKKSRLKSHEDLALEWLCFSCVVCLWDWITSILGENMEEAMVTISKHKHFIFVWPESKHEKYMWVVWVKVLKNFELTPKEKEKESWHKKRERQKYQSWIVR